MSTEFAKGIFRYKDDASNVQEVAIADFIPPIGYRVHGHRVAVVDIDYDEEGHLKPYVALAENMADEPITENALDDAGFYHWEFTYFGKAANEDKENERGIQVWFDESAPTVYAYEGLGDEQRLIRLPNVKTMGDIGVALRFVGVSQ